MQQKMQRPWVPDDTAELLKTLKWSDCLPHFFWVSSCLVLKEGRKEGREGGRREVEGKEGGEQEGRKERRGEGGREGFYFLCAQEAGDMMEEGHGDRVLHHNGTCTRCNTQKGLSIFTLCNCLPNWQLLYWASLKLFLCHCVINVPRDHKLLCVSDFSTQNLNTDGVLFTLILYCI